MRFTKLGRSYLEIIFKFFTKLNFYISNGISLLEQIYLGYYASTNNRNYLNISIKDIPIMDSSAVSDAIKEFFTNIRTIAAIKPLIYAGTKFLSDQWQIILDITDRENITKQIPRCIELLGNKALLSWKNTSLLYLFCLSSLI